MIKESHANYHGFRIWQIEPVKPTLEEDEKVQVLRELSVEEEEASTPKLVGTTKILSTSPRNMVVKPIAKGEPHYSKTKHMTGL